MPHDAPKHHPTAVEGYEGSLPRLTGDIHRMRYDMVQEFYRYTVQELRRQADGDLAIGRPRLAMRLKEAAQIADQLEQKFKEIYGICRLYMQNEL